MRCVRCHAEPTKRNQAVMFARRAPWQRPTEMERGAAITSAARAVFCYAELFTTIYWSWPIYSHGQDIRDRATPSLHNVMIKTFHDIIRSFLCREGL